MKLHQAIQHPNIIAFLDSLQINHMVYFLLEYAGNGNLYFFIHTKQGLPEHLAMRFLYQTAKAVKYLHDRKLIHRDIKPENILLDEQFNVKLCDFGWSCEMEQEEDFRTSVCGTYEYMSPEIVHYRRHNSKVDIWCLGILLYEMLHGLPPFKADNLTTLRDEFLTKDLKFKRNISKDIKDLLEQLTIKDDQIRPDIDAVLRHPAFRSREKSFKEMLSKEDFALLIRNYMINTDANDNKALPEALQNLVYSEENQQPKKSDTYKPVNLVFNAPQPSPSFSDPIPTPIKDNEVKTLSFNVENSKPKAEPQTNQKPADNRPFVQSQPPPQERAFMKKKVQIDNKKTQKGNILNFKFNWKTEKKANQQIKNNLSQQARPIENLQNKKQPQLQQKLYQQQQHKNTSLFINPTYTENRNQSNYNNSLHFDARKQFQTPLKPNFNTPNKNLSKNQQAFNQSYRTANHSTDYSGTSNQTYNYSLNYSNVNAAVMDNPSLNFNTFKYGQVKKTPKPLETNLKNISFREFDLYKEKNKFKNQSTVYDRPDLNTNKNVSVNIFDADVRREKYNFGNPLNTDVRNKIKPKISVSELTSKKYQNNFTSERNIPLPKTESFTKYQNNFTNEKKNPFA